MDLKYWLEAENICAFKNNYEVIKDLNLKLKLSENVVILGPNGSGKSSIIDLINRNIYPVEKKNSVFKIFDNKLIDIWELRKKISTVNNEIKTRIRPDLKVFDLILSGFHGKYCKVNKYTENEISETKKLISKMSLTSISHKKFSYLSDGEKQIALIARAVIKNPKILILDEPTINLDFKSKFFVIDKINELSKTNTLILSITHDISMISTIYKRVILLKDRNIISDGQQKEVLTEKNLSKLFDVDIKILKVNGKWNIYKGS